MGNNKSLSFRTKWSSQIDTLHNDALVPLWFSTADTIKLIKAL